YSLVDHAVDELLLGAAAVEAAGGVADAEHGAGEGDGHAAGQPELAADEIGGVVFAGGLGAAVGVVDLGGPVVDDRGVFGDIEVFEAGEAAGDDEGHDKRVDL